MDLSTIWLLIVSFSVFCIILILVDLSLSFYGLTILEFLFEDKLLLSSKETFTSSFLLSLFSVVCIRLIANKFLSEENTSIKVAIYGAGSAGIQLAGALRVSHEMQPVAFIDSNKSLHDTFIGGIKVLHPKKLRKLVMRGKIDEVLIAIPSASKSLLRSLLEEIENYSVKVRILPGLAELAQGKVLVSELKEVNVTDLLGRLEIEANKTLLSKNIDGKVVLITGAGGSIGSEISRQVVENNARKIIILDSNEYALYSIKKEIENSSKEVNLYSVLGSVTNKKRIIDICKTFNVDTIYHAAAYKHVPIVEENPFEAVHNNIFGTKSCVEAALESKVETFVLISTDKAVRPTNIMGATKRFSELILQSLSPNPHTRMIMVRFGNVIGSSGSAIPLFQQQIKDGGPVTVTHPEVIRYFMSIPEAAELVIQAGAMGQGGDVFVLDMGEPVKIYKLAEKLIKLSGMELKDKEHQDGDIEIIFTGLRPGEKLYEELLIGDNVSATQHKQILRAEEDYLSADQLLKHLESLKKAEDNSDVSSLRKILEDVVSGYTPESEIVDVVYQQKQ
jgi:FlaA1/EpsC-like NDP-sugar epimerase